MYDKYFIFNIRFRISQDITSGFWRVAGRWGGVGGDQVPAKVTWKKAGVGSLVTRGSLSGL